jgi:hypothetical protein
MKRNAYCCVIASLFALLVPIAFAQDKSDDLAAYARQHKKDKQAAPAPAKVYDDDNLPKTTHISVVGSESPATPADGSSASTTQDANAQPNSADTSTRSDDNKPAQPEAGQSQQDRQQANTDWENKIKEQKQAVDLAQRELDVLQREYRLKQAVVSSDVGYRLRNAAQWDKDDKQYKEQIAAKQKSFDDAKQKLTALQEDARKAGVPSKIRE